MADFVSLDGKLVKDQVLQDGIEDIEDEMHTNHILGLYADFDESTFTRLFAAKGLTAGSDFDAFGMYGQRKLCNVADDGTITAWYGDENYTETGYTTITDPQTQQETTIQVQVMVRQPKFWYKVVPVELEEITSDDPTQTGVHGYSGVRMKYYIADRPIPGFKLHPAFFNAQGQEVDCYYIGAYEACLYDVSENEYRLYDTWDVSESGGVYTINALNTYLADANNDKLCSIAGVKPASGEYSTQFTRPNVNKMAKNRGDGWGSLNVKIVSAEQLLFAVEFASFNSQACIGEGVVDYAVGSHNVSAFTGSTASIGNGTGMAESTVRLTSSGTVDTGTTDGYVSIRYRGVENIWGNINCYMSGVNSWGDGTMLSGEPYICDDFAYAESKNTDNYKPAGFVMPYTQGTSYIKYFGYNEGYDWLFMPSKLGGSSALPVGDSAYTENKLNRYAIGAGFGYWSYGHKAGMFMNYANAKVSYRAQNLGGQLIRV